MNAACLLAVLLAAVAVTSADLCKNNFDYPGNDYNRDCLPTAKSAQECANKCADAPGGKCKAFTYLKGDYKEAIHRGKCCLKTRAANGAPLDGVISGTPGCIGTHLGLCENNVDYLGGDYECTPTATTKTAQQCANKCAAAPGGKCTRFTYLKGDFSVVGRRGQCCLKDGNVIVQKMKGVISGMPGCTATPCENNVDYLGADITCKLVFKTLRECSAECLKNPECKSFTYFANPPNYPNDIGRCCLKNKAKGNSVVRGDKGQGFISGFKGCLNITDGL